MGFFDTVASIATGGVYDVIQGEAPFSSAIESVFGSDSSVTGWLKDVSSQLFSGGFDQLPKAFEKASRQDGFGNKVATFFDRAADPAGTIDYATRKSGQVIPSQVHDVVEPIGNAISGIMGPGYAAGFAGIAGKMQGRDDLTNWRNAGIAALRSYLANGVDGGELTLDAIAKAVAKGAINYGTNELLKSLGKHNSTFQYAINPTISEVPFKLGGLLSKSGGVGWGGSTPHSSITPAFTKTPVANLADYDTSKEQKIAEVLTDPYKNYKLNDYMLYKVDPDKLRDILEKYS